MSEPLAVLFAQFVKERIYLKAVSAKTEAWYRTAWKAFQASQTAHDDGGITKAGTQRLSPACLHCPERPSGRARGSPLCGAHDLSRIDGHRPARREQARDQ